MPIMRDNLHRMTKWLKMLAIQAILINLFA